MIDNLNILNKWKIKLSIKLIFVDGFQLNNKRDDFYNNFAMSVYSFIMDKELINFCLDPINIIKL